MSPGALLILFCSLAAETAQSSVVIPDYAMDSDPQLPSIEITKAFSEKYLPLWLQALQRPEAEMQRLAAATLAHAHEEGVPKLDQARPTLIRIVSEQQTHPTARLAAARTLVVLDAQEAAPQLLAAAQAHGADLRHIVEPALARWKHEPAYEVWRKRFSSGQTTHRDLILAIRCLGEVEDEAALELLLAMVRNPLRQDAVRLAAARAAGQIKQTGLEADAQKLARSKSQIVDSLCSVALLGRHQSQPARDVLLSLALNPQPSVAGAALARLNAIDFALVLPLVERALQSPDAGVRREAARAYAALPSKERIPVLARLLDDPHPELRGMVREELFRLAHLPEWKDAVIEHALAALLLGGWRGQEQAALLLAALDHKPAAQRLVELLESPRGEVMIAAAWGLRKLAVKETLPAMLDKATRQTAVRLKYHSFGPLDAQVGHLFEGLGLMKYQPAEKLMRQYIAKNYTMGELSRSGAIWGLGHLHAGQPDDALAAEITKRVTEVGTASPPEMMRVRIAGAMAVGRMKAVSQADALRTYVAGGGTGKTFLSIRWALQELTGEVLPLYPVTVSKGGWFLEPLE